MSTIEITLEGSEKQIAWATQIRAEMLSKPGIMMISAANRAGKLPEFKAASALIGKNFDQSLVDAVSAAAVAFMTTEANTQTSAKWWIDNRDDAAAQLLAIGDAAARFDQAITAIIA